MREFFPGGCRAAHEPAAINIMMIRAALLCVVTLFLCQSASAQGISGRVAWYGVYTVSKSEEIKDPTSPTGSRFVSTPVPPKSNAAQIPGKQIRFGMSYVLSGGPKQVTVKHVYRFPPPGMPDTATGGPRTTYEFIRKANMGEHVLMGWSFEGASPEQIVLGEWILEVWTNNRKVVEKHFNVVSP
jgi:hypothetical protein